MCSINKAAIIYNPWAGNGQPYKWAVRLCELFKERKGIQPEIICPDIEIQENTYTVAKKLSKQGYGLLVAIGGDGTINKVVGGILDGDGLASLGIIPIGSVNNFARALGIPLSPHYAIENILYGRAKAVDVGKVNDSYMISSMTLGLLADIAKNVTTVEKKRWGALAFLKNLFTIILKNKKYTLKIVHDEGVLSKELSILLVAMTDSLGGMKSFTPSARVDDGYFHVYTIPDISLRDIIKNLPELALGSFGNISGIDYFTTSSLKISCSRRKRKVSTRIDGDPSFLLPVTMKIINKGLNVIVPNPSFQ